MGGRRMTPETLKAWRARLSLGEAGMAAYLGVPVTTYRKWENGTRKPDAAPLRLFEVLQLIESKSGDLHTLMVYEATKAENRPVKARKPRAATLAPAAPAAPAVGPDSGVPAPIPWDDIHKRSVERLSREYPTPWVHAAQALPDWMKSGA